MSAVSAGNGMGDREFGAKVGRSSLQWGPGCFLPTAARPVRSWSLLNILDTPKYGCLHMFSWGNDKKLSGFGGQQKYFTHKKNTSSFSSISFGASGLSGGTTVASNPGVDPSDLTTQWGDSGGFHGWVRELKYII